MLTVNDPSKCRTDVVKLLHSCPVGYEVICHNDFQTAHTQVFAILSHLFNANVTISQMQTTIVTFHISLIIYVYILTNLARRNAHGKKQGSPCILSFCYAKLS